MRDVNVMVKDVIFPMKMTFSDLPAIIFSESRNHELTRSRCKIASRNAKSTQMAQKSHFGGNFSTLESDTLGTQWQHFFFYRNPGR